MCFREVSEAWSHAFVRSSLSILSPAPTCHPICTMVLPHGLSQVICAFVPSSTNGNHNSTCFIELSREIIFLNFYLFMIVTQREREKERERGRDTGRGRSRLHAPGARSGLRSQVSMDRALGQRQEPNRCATQGSLNKYFFKAYCAPQDGLRSWKQRLGS